MSYKTKIQNQLFITVGGAPDPVKESIDKNKPKKILFIWSEKSKKDFLKHIENPKDYHLEKLLIDMNRLKKSVSDFKPKTKNSQYNSLLDSIKELSVALDEKTNKMKTDMASSSSSNHLPKREHTWKQSIQKQFNFLDRENISELILNDHEDIQKTISQMKDKADFCHKEWIANGSDYTSIVDITGGTKVMSSALALVAHSWEQCLFSYIGGKKRDKGGVGIVEKGFEKPLLKYNPWEILGYQYVEEAVILFDRFDFTAAYSVLENAFNNMIKSSKGVTIDPKPIENQTENQTEKILEETDSAQAQLNMQDTTSPKLKREILAAKAYINAFKCWDNFAHKEAYRCLKNIRNNRLNDLKAVFKGFSDIDFEKTVEESIEYLEQILNNKKKTNSGNSLYKIFDLIVNAERRAKQGKFDDASARLYRSIEAMGQYCLQEKYQLDSSKIPYSELPHELKDKKLRDKHFKFSVSTEDRENEHLIECKLALQDLYCLLLKKEDPIGKKFKSLGLEGQKSPLFVRNQSILAHGFNTLTEKDYKRLLQPVLELFKVLVDDFSPAGYDFNFEEKHKPPFFPIF